jgi:hypothetical protein
VSNPFTLRLIFSLVEIFFPQKKRKLFLHFLTKGKIIFLPFGKSFVVSKADNGKELNCEKFVYFLVPEQFPSSLASLFIIQHDTETNFMPIMETLPPVETESLKDFPYISGEVKKYS